MAQFPFRTEPATFDNVTVGTRVVYIRDHGNREIGTTGTVTSVVRETDSVRVDWDDQDRSSASAPWLSSIAVITGKTTYTEEEVADLVAELGSHLGRLHSTNEWAKSKGIPVDRKTKVTIEVTLPKKVTTAAIEYELARAVETLGGKVASFLAWED